MTTNQQATAAGAGSIQRIRYTHDAMIDIILANPELSQREIAARFGYSENWVSRIFCSDAFAARLEQRKKETVDPVVIFNLEERMKGLASTAVEVISERLATTRNPELAMKALDISSRALGFGARNAAPVQVNNNFVVAMPPKIVDAQEWAKSHGRAPIEAAVEKES